MYRVLAEAPIGMLEAILHQWAEENLVDLPPANEEMEGVALDGKALRGSRRRGASDAHLLSAFSHRLGLTLKQLGVDDKTNEIGTMPELLVDLVVEGRIFTMDALHTQRETAQTIDDGGGDYVMIAKGNQPTLQNEIETLFARPDAEALIDDCDITVDRGHGRIEVRVLHTSSALHDTLDWPGQQQVFCVERQATIVKTGKVRTETVYGVTSLVTSEANAARLQELVRGQ